MDNEAPDTSERELILPSPRERVWAALTQADQLAACLADRTRRQVLRLVAVRGPTSATTLERELPVTRQAIVKHLVVLSRAGLVAGRRLPRQSGY